MVIKKLVAVCFSILMLIGCGKSTGTNTSTDDIKENTPIDVSKLKTIGDIYAVEPNVKERGNTENTYFIVFEKNDTVYRAYSDLSKEKFDELMALEFDDPDYEKKHIEIAGPLEIRQLDNLTEKIPTQEELDKLVGKTGKDLFDDGWTEGYGYDLNDMNFYLYKGPFCFEVYFEKDKEYENTDDFDVWETISPLTVKSVNYYGIGNGSEL